MTKKCIVESARGFRVLGKLVNPGKEVELSTREIFDVLKMHGVKIYELVDGKKIKLDVTNYKISNVDKVEVKKPEPVKIDAATAGKEIPVQEKAPVVKNFEPSKIEEVKVEGPKVEEAAPVVEEKVEAPVVEEKVEEPAVEEEVSEEVTAEEEVSEETPVEEEVAEEQPKNNNNNYNKYNNYNKKRH